MRRRTKKFILAALLVCAVGLGVAIDAIWVEPYQVTATHHRISARVPAAFKIAHLSDVHTYGVGEVEKRTLRLVESERPDIIVITGDLISHSSSYVGCREFLRGLNAPMGVWAVHGNHEAWWPVKDEHAYFSSAGVKMLVNESAQVTPGVWIVGFDDAFGGSPDLEKGLAGTPADSFKIALFHSPDFYDEVAGRCNLALAGHTHGGQVRLPFIKPFWLPPRCGAYLEGWYDKAGSRMYVSRGIGTSVLPIRFLCKPEVAFISIEPE